MHLTRRLALCAATSTLPLLILPRAAHAATVVKVKLWDKGPTSMDMQGSVAPMGMAMPDAKMDLATMGITLDVATAPAGEVTFRVTNESAEFYHSLGIAPVTDPTTELPYLAEQMMLDEEAAGRVARVKELRPHDSGSVTVDLQPGTYILYCNVSGHYMMGMWALFTVAA